jgi:hypothetical protein
MTGEQTTAGLAGDFLADLETRIAARGELYKNDEECLEAIRALIKQRLSTGFAPVVDRKAVKLAVASSMFKAGGLIKPVGVDLDDNGAYHKAADLILDKVADAICSLAKTEAQVAADARYGLEQAYRELVQCLGLDSLGEPWLEHETVVLPAASRAQQQRAQVEEALLERLTGNH